MSRRFAPIYPAYTFHESKTWHAWVKFTAADVFALKEKPGFEGQDVYFHLNHPIRYVCLTGLVINIEDKFDKYTLLALDDGSGAVITVKITRLTPEEVENNVDHTSNTTVDNVDVVSAVGSYDVRVDKKSLDIGALIKVKCTISTFRDSRQLELKRIWVLRSTAEEIKEWAEAAKLKREVLSEPWMISKQRLAELAHAEVEKRKRREEAARMEEQRARLNVKKKEKREERRREHEERKEMRRRKEEMAMNAGAIV